MKLDTLIEGHAGNCRMQVISLSLVFMELLPFLNFAIKSMSGAYNSKYRTEYNET